jgi:hypothetical protein
MIHMQLCRGPDLVETSRLHREEMNFTKTLSDPPTTDGNRASHMQTGVSVLLLCSSIEVKLNNKMLPTKSRENTFFEHKLQSQHIF